MSHLYEAGLTVTPATGPVPLVTISVPAGGIQVEVREIAVSVVTATIGSNVQVGRPAAAGTGAPTGSLVQAADAPDITGVTTVATTFATTQPTAPTVAMRQYRMSTTAGCCLSCVWDPGEVLIPAGGQLSLWLLIGTGTYDIYVKVAE